MHPGNLTTMDTDKVNDSAEAIESVNEKIATIPGLLQPMSKEEFAAVEKRLKRKLDLRLASMIVLIYILNFLDRVRAGPSRSIKIVC